MNEPLLLMLLLLVSLVLESLGVIIVIVMPSGDSVELVDALLVRVTECVYVLVRLAVLVDRVNAEVCFADVPVDRLDECVDRVIECVDAV